MASDLYITSYSQSYSEFGLMQSKLWKKGTLCMTIAGENTGEVAILKFDSCFPDSIVGFVADPAKADVRFIKYLLDTMKRDFKGISRGATQDNLSLDKLLSFDLPIPPLNTQQRIGDILSAYDDLIENNTRRIKILEQMAQMLYREWFVNFRFPGHETVKMVESEMGLIPKGWATQRIEDICSLIVRGVTPMYCRGSGRYIINQRANRGPEIDIKELKELAPELAVPKERLAQYGDVLVNCLGEGTIGRVNYFIGPDKTWAVDQHMTICRAEDLALTSFLYMNLSSEEGQARIQSLKTGATNMTMFNISALRTYQLLVPIDSLLRVFHKTVAPIRKLQSILQEKTQNLRTTRDLLIPKLVSGEVSVEDLEEEALAETV
jgi:type I restriction enzyme, S subunit